MVEYLEIGKIVNTHGVKGEIKVLPLTDDQGRFEKLKKVFVQKGEDRKEVDILDVKFQKNMVILRLKGIEGIAAAEALRDSFLVVDRKHAVKLPNDAFFICDLLECSVYEESGKLLGVLKDVLKTGSNDVYVVKGEENKEILIPALKSVVKEISIEDKKMVVALPEGLIENEI